MPLQPIAQLILVDNGVVKGIETTDGQNLVTVVELSELSLNTVDTSTTTTDPSITDPASTGIALPSSGQAIYTTVSNSTPTDGTLTGTLNTTTTYLNVNFVDASATAKIDVNFNNLNMVGDTTQAMNIDANGAFSGNLYVSATDPMGFASPQSGSGTVAGSLSGTPEAVIGAPSDANMAYTMNTGGNSVSGDITLGASAVTP